MLERHEIKARARDQIRGNIGSLFVISLLAAVICAVTSFASILVVGPLTLSLAFIYKGMANGEKPKPENIFDGFKQNFAGSIVASLLVGIFVILWGLISFGILAIVKGYSYSMTFYILADNPDMTATDAITESRRIMNGNKFKLFVQRLSFIGWILLCIVTFGLAAIYVGPYITAADYNFYLNIKDEAPQE